MFTTKARTAAAAMAVGLVAAATATTPAFASHGGDGVRKSGSCTMAAVWKLKAKPDSGRIEVEGQVDSNVAGQTWKWQIRHDGHVSLHGRATTQSPSGSFSVERLLVDTAGSDRIGWRAVNLRSGERCLGSVRV